MPLTAPLPPKSDRPGPAMDPFQVTAIGSCRIAGPLRQATAADGFSLNQSGVHGYCHSSAEALQQVKVLLGETVIPSEIAPLVAPSAQRGANHDPSDLYFVEICSAKLLSTHGYAVQLNYLTRHFADFFASRERARTFWRLSLADDRRAIGEFLDGEESFQALSDQDRDLLKDLRMEMASRTRLRADIAGICDRLDEVLFVTHFNVRKHDGAVLKARSDFIAMLRSVLDDMKVRYFDPSDYVEAFGMNAALATGAQALTHYAPEFEHLLLDNWLRRYIRPLDAARRGEPPPRPRMPQQVATA